MSERQSARRRPRTGRDPSAAAPPGPAYLKREIPPYEFMNEEGLVRIEQAADTILSDVGIRFFGDEEALRLWKEAGASVDGDRVRFDPGHVRSIVQKTAPSEFTQLARNSAKSVVLGGNNTVFAPAYGSPFVRSLDERRRYASLDDFRNFVKLAYMSPWLHHSGGTVCEPVEIPVNKRHLDMVHTHLTCSDKPIMGSVTAAERSADSIDMCRIVFGEETVEDNCVIMGNINVNSPLTYDEVMSGVLRTYAAANQATVVVPFILGGAMGPVTNAGAIAQALAEAMVGIALIQLVRPGAPGIFGTFLSSMSLRSGAPTFGMPEPGIGTFVVGQLARRLGVPFRSGGALTSSKVPDAQAAQESADSLMPAIMAGTNFILHAAGWLEGGLTMGYEKFMIDQDHLGMMHVFAKGVSTSDNDLALDAFRECGPGQHFLGCAHTMANYQTAFFDSEISDSNSYEQWRDGGRKDAIQRANERWKAALAAYETPPIDPGIADGLTDFVARKKEAMADAWY
ncbi:MAG: trimethylamine methyltransferase family protein [Alphaproteobacteria bacterium]